MGDHGDFVCIRCLSEVYAIHISLTKQVSDLKVLVAARHRFPRNGRLVFRGNLLNSEATLAMSGVSSGDLIVALSPLSEVTIRIMPSGSSSFLIGVSLVSSVAELRAMIAERLCLQPNQLHLVHRGKVLEDPFSIGYYEVVQNSIVRTLIVKRATQLCPIWPSLVESLRHKITQFVNSSPWRQSQIGREITQLTEDPVLKASTAVNTPARVAVDDAVLVLEAAQSPLTCQLNYVAAVINDLMMFQYEATAQGMRLLNDLFLKKSPTRSLPIPSQLNYDAKLSEEPLPILWNTRSTSMDGWWRSGRDSHAPTRQAFSREICTLKRMGFNDELLIARTLKETSGNIQRAAKLLMRTIPIKY